MMPPRTSYRDATWYGFAKAIFAGAAAKSPKLIPITSVAHVPPEDRLKIEAALPKQAIVISHLDAVVMETQRRKVRVVAGKTLGNRARQDGLVARRR